MERVTIRFLMWLGKELGPDWVSPTDSRATMHTEVPAGTSVADLLEKLAEAYTPVREKVFLNGALSPHVVAILNNRGMGRDELLSTVLADGDSITVVPLIVGG